MAEIILGAWWRDYKRDANGNVVHDASGRAQRIAAPGGLWNLLAIAAKDLSAHFHAVQLPPWSLTQSGTNSTGDGYGVVNRFVLNGTFWQTAHGQGQKELCAAVNELKAYGVECYGDLVLHQFAQMPANLDKSCFRGECSWNDTKGAWNDPIPPFARRDDVPDPAHDFAFGLEVSYQNAPADPHSGVTRTIADASDYLQWVSSLTGVTKYRYDDVKGAWPPAVRAIINALPAGTFYSEFFDGGTWPLDWATSQPLNGRSGVEDFMLHWRIQKACNTFDARELVRGGAGLWERRPDLSYGFVDNPDTDTSDGQQVIFNKCIAYAYLLALPLRSALIYGKDYDPSAYGLKPHIDNLCWISRMFAFGKYQVRWSDQDVHVATRDGDGGSYGWSGGLLTALNFNTLAARTVTVATHWAEGRHLHDYTGHAGDVWVGHNGNVTITIPSNAYSRGLSYCCYAPAGVGA